MLKHIHSGKNSRSINRHQFGQWKLPGFRRRPRGWTFWRVVVETPRFALRNRSSDFIFLLCLEFTGLMFLLSEELKGFEIHLFFCHVASRCRRHRLKPLRRVGPVEGWTNSQFFQLFWLVIFKFDQAKRLMISLNLPTVLVYILIILVWSSLYITYITV